MIYEKSNKFLWLNSWECTKCVRLWNFDAKNAPCPVDKTKDNVKIISIPLPFANKLPMKLDLYYVIFKIFNLIIPAGTLTSIS